MGILKTNKAMERLNQMIDNAIEGKPIEKGFDETKMSALETKLSDYLAMSSVTKEQLMEEKGKVHQLISDISHQTKTPLTNILLYTQLLSESELSEKDRECLEYLTEQAQKLNFLIASLVKSSRLEAGIITVAPMCNGISQMLESVMNQIKPNADAKRVSVTMDEIDIYSYFDPKWTEEAIYNLMDNAVKYTNSGGSVHVSASVYEFFCCIDISDTGIGIEEEETAKIFSRFYRASEVRDEDGVGIGLYLAREIISAQGGYIRVRSEKGKGSTFSVFLPMEER